LFGFGTWVAITGRVVVGLDASDSAFDTVGETGGSKDAVVVSHTHTVTDPGHTHTTNARQQAGSATGLVGGGLPLTATATIDSATTGISVDYTGSSATNANLQPYVVAYVWKRTA
jgi:microcystin-dependent protein